MKIVFIALTVICASGLSLAHLLTSKPYSTELATDLWIDDPKACDPHGTGLLIQDEDRRIGNIVSPGYNKISFEPPINKSCSWTIWAPQGFIVWLNIEGYRLDRECIGDISVYDGFSSNGTRIERICGWGQSRNIQSPRNLVHITFNSVMTRTQKVAPRFNMWYVFVKSPAKCGHQLSCRHNMKRHGPVLDLPNGCYSESQTCDGIDHCGDGTDEENCPQSHVLEDEFMSMCGQPAVQPISRFSTRFKIKSGRTAKPGSWPWQVSLSADQFEPTKAHVCGAVVIARQWVLTAAHCFMSPFASHDDPSRWSMHFGKYNILMRDNEIEVIRYPAKIFFHPDFNGYPNSSNPDDGRSDIALIKLNAPLPVENPFVRPLCLPPKDLVARDGDVGIAAGWGDVVVTGELLLKQASLPVIDKGVCEQIYRGSDTEIDDTILCAGYMDGGADSCEGDSGGPYMFMNESRKRWQLHGIISKGGEPCGSRLLPGLYTFIPRFLQWIHQVTSLNQDSFLFSS